MKKQVKTTPIPSSQIPNFGDSKTDDSTFTADKAEEGTLLIHAIREFQPVFPHRDHQSCVG